MFSKLLTVNLVVALGALQTLAQSLPEDTYEILNEDCFTKRLRSYHTGENIFLPSSLESQGTFGGTWEVGPYTHGANTIRNVDLNAFTFVTTETEGVAVITDYRQSTEWAITPAGEDTFTISAINKDLLWTSKCLLGRSNVLLRPADGSSAQRWSFI